LRHIKYIQEKYPKIKIKIGTVVSQYNINELEELGEKLSKILRKNDVWRLYQFSPIGIGKLNESDFFIDEDKFNSEIKKIKMKYDNINISPLSVEEANDAYIFITPDLRLAEFTNNMFDFINYLENLSQEEIEDILCNDRKILKNIEHNREWLKP
jgi:hypothetical protein